MQITKTLQVRAVISKMATLFSVERNPCTQRNISSPKLKRPQSKSHVIKTKWSLRYIIQNWLYWIHSIHLVIIKLQIKEAASKGKKKAALCIFRMQILVNLCKTNDAADFI